MCKATPARLHSTSVWKRHGLVRTLGRVVGAGRGVAQRDVGDGRGSGGISSEGMKGTLASSIGTVGKSIVSFAFSSGASLWGAQHQGRRTDARAPEPSLTRQRTADYEGW